MDVCGSMGIFVVLVVRPSIAEYRSRKFAPVHDNEGYGMLKTRLAFDSHSTWDKIKCGAGAET